MFLRRFLPATGNLLVNHSVLQCLTIFYVEIIKLITDSIKTAKSHINH